MSEKNFKNLKKIAPFVFGIVQTFGNAIFSLTLTFFLIAVIIIGGLEINSLSNRIEKLEAKEQNITELKNEVAEQRKAIEILIAERERQVKSDKLDDTLDKFWERAIKFGEILREQEKKQ